MPSNSRRAAALRTISRFVLRAKLVQEHSLASDKGVLEKHAAWTMTFIVTHHTATGKQAVAMKPAPLLPTEQVESAAARVRPVFLVSDGLHYDKVLNALGEAGAVSASLKKDIGALRAKFQSADPDYPNGRPTEPRTKPSMTNKEIAGAWLYGQLLHEDAVRRSYGTGISAEEMLLTATRTVCSEMLATVEALHLIEKLVVDGTLAVPEDLFTEPVSVTATEWAPRISSAYVADMGTPLPASITEALGSEWSEVQDVFGPGGGHTRVKGISTDGNGCLIQAVYASSG